MRHEAKITRPTLATLIARIEAAGEKIGVAFEDDQVVYASSVALNGHGMYAEPRHRIQWSSGYLVETRPYPKGINRRAVLRVENHLATLPGRETDEANAARAILAAAKTDFVAFAEGMGVA